MLSALNIPEHKIKQLNRAGIETLSDLLQFLPKKHKSREKLTGFVDAPEETVILIRAEQVKYISKAAIVKLMGRESSSGAAVHILWFNQSYLYTKLTPLIGTEILVAGIAAPKEAQYGEPPHYEIVAPAVFDERGAAGLGIYPTYRKIPGMNEEYLKGCISKAAYLLGKPQETIPEQIVMKRGLLGYGDMIGEMHWPTSQENLQKAYDRKLWEDLFYFALRIEMNYRGTAQGSPFNLPSIRMATDILNSLPYQLTADQEGTYTEILRMIRSGKRLNALVQGDVGCGKTILAFLLMVAFAENGCQAVLMAPTQILAEQHYKALSKLVAPYGLPVAFVSSRKLRKPLQLELEEKIASGEYSLIVGTQALLSETYKFHKLALVVEDEEHKYGVMQRKMLTDKAALGTHIVTMSATPIPRTLAQTIYGDNVQLFSIHTKPAGRQPIRTGIAENMQRVFQFVYSEVKRQGHQIYVVCPMIAPNEKVEGVATTEETLALYKKALEPHGICVEMVTGKTRKAEATEIFEQFAENKVSVLISTTVIEVGINNPNATGIIIHNAERFGLAQLHQLRGRVGRGSAPGVCVLVSNDKQNPRLDALCKYTDGFQIAEMDLNLRGAGDFLGSQQSGTERYLAMALARQEEYKKAQEDAKWLLDTGLTCSLLDRAEADHRNNIGGVMLQQ